VAYEWKTQKIDILGGKKDLLFLVINLKEKKIEIEILMPFYNFFFFLIRN
jgi:hypothetical protein